MSSIAPHSVPLVSFLLPCSSRHRGGWEPHVCRSDNSCSTTTMDSTRARETRALSRCDFPRISREKNWSRTMEKLQKRPHLAYEKYTIFWSRRRTFPLLWVFQIQTDRVISLPLVSPIWTMSEYRLRYFHVARETDALSTLREYGNVNKHRLPCARFMRIIADISLLDGYL